MLAEEIAFSDLDAGVTQDRVSGRGVEEEIRQHEVIEVVVALHLRFLRPEWEGDVAVG